MQAVTADDPGEMRARMPELGGLGLSDVRCSGFGAIGFWGERNF